MESMESYPELNVSVEGLCEHIKESPSLELYIEDPSKWYCTSCSKAFSSREDVENHSNTNMFGYYPCSLYRHHNCFYNVNSDCLVCTQCQKRIVSFVEKNCASDQDEDSDSDISSDGDDVHGHQRLPPKVSRDDAYTGPTIDLDELVEGLQSNRFKNIVVLAGAGISCASGIPDFRSANGLYRNLNKYPVPFLRDPSTIFDIRDFREYTVPFWILAKEMFYTNNLYHPTPCHFFLQLLAQKGILRRVYTQNIDGLERKAGLDSPILIEGHGTCSKCACCVCGHKYEDSVPQQAVNGRTIPLCGVCGGSIKPSIVFFGEDLPEVFYESIIRDSPDVDLLIVMGTSLQVHPMCGIPYRIPTYVPRVLINNQQVGAFNSDLMNNLTLLGDCQNLVLSIIEMSGWRSIYEEMIEQYKKDNHVDEFLWESQYNFNQIESNLKDFEKQLEEDDLHENEENVIVSDSDSDSEDEESISQTENEFFNILHRAGVKNIELDDGRDLPSYCNDEEKEKSAAYFFMKQIVNHRINNSMKHDVRSNDPSESTENVVLRCNGVLLTLNQANSRCYREIMKWGEWTVNEFN